MNIFRYGIAFILTILMIFVDVMILFIGGVVTLWDGLANRNWDFGSVLEFMENRLDTYAEYWSIVRK